MPARVSTSPSRASSAEYSSFIDSVLEHVCCASTASRLGNNNYNHNYQDRHRSSDDCHNDDCTNVTNNAPLCGAGAAGRDDDGCISRQKRRGSRENNISFFGKNGSSSSKKVYHDHPDRDCQNSFPEIILPHLRFQPLTIDATSYDVHYRSTTNGNADEKSPPAAETETAEMMISSLDEFYNLFLANDAPHSFDKFHEKNGDDNVRITPWKKVSPKSEGSNGSCQNKSTEMIKEMERTITFQTRMTSGSSGKSFSFGNDKSNNNNSISSKRINSQSASATTQSSSSHSSMTLGLIVVQRLIRHFARIPGSDDIAYSPYNHSRSQKYLKWVLESHISFDYSDGNSCHSSGDRGSDDYGNYGTNYSCSIFNNLGGKLSLGLGSFFISNEVKSSTVCVRVILTEGDGAAAVTPPGSPSKNFTAMGNDSDVGGNSDVCHNQGSKDGSDEDTAPPQSSFGYLSCFSHPLLLPPGSLCGAGKKWIQGDEGDSPPLVAPTKKNFSKATTMSTNSLLDLENRCMGGGCASPSEVGASLLSAIKAKNAPMEESDPKNDVDEDDDFHGTAAELTVPETPPPTPPLSRSLLDSSSFMDLFVNTQKQIMNIANKSDDDNDLSSASCRKSAKTLLRRDKQLSAKNEDILSSNTSRGTLKLKHISSFEYAREPSVASASEGHLAMRRMILEKDSEKKMFSFERSQRDKSLSHNVPSLNGTDSESFAGLPLSSSCSSFSNRLVTTPVALQGLSMRIEMQVRSLATGSISSNASSSTSTTQSPFCSPSNSKNNSDSQSSCTSTLTIPFHRSKGSFSSPLNEKILRNIRKRVSRTWISWAESWCMRVWEEEEAERSRHKVMGLAVGPSSLIPRRSKMNVRPVVRRLSSGRGKRDRLGGSIRDNGSGSEGGGTMTSERPLVSTSLLSRSQSLVDGWQSFDIRSILGERSMKYCFSDRIEKWMFVVGTNGMGGGDIGIEVICILALKQNSLRLLSPPPCISTSLVHTDGDERAYLHSEDEAKSSASMQMQNATSDSIVAKIDSTSRRYGWKKALRISGRRLMPK